MKKKIFSLLLAAVLAVALGVGIHAEDGIRQPIIKTDYGCASMLHALHLLEGKSVSADGTINFDVDGGLTRAEAFVQIIRFLGVENTVKAGSFKHPFTDVPAWADAYIGYAYENGIACGRSATIFDPNGTVDAAQFTTLLLRAIGYSDAAGEFNWQQPFALAKRIGMANTATAPEGFTRGDAFRICVRTLYAKAKDGSSVYEKLAKAGVFTLNEMQKAAVAAENAVEPITDGYYVLSKEEYMDKTTAGFLSQVAGVFSGYEFVRTNGQLYVGMPDNWYKFLAGPYAVRNAHNQHETKLIYNSKTKLWESWLDDDYSIDILNLYILRDMHAQYGTVASKVITDDWVKYNVYDMGGGHRSVGAYGLMKFKRYLPAFSGSAEYGNRYNYCTEPWIENETLGMVTAGMPNAAADLTDIFAAVTGDRENVDWTRFMSVMYSLAYFEKDIPTLICRAAEIFGEGTYEREVVDTCFALYEQYPDDWRAACRAAERAVLRKHDRMSDTALQLEMNVNNAFVLLGLLYGGGDYEETCKILSLAGYDGDCTAAVGLSILGIIGGMDALPEKINERIWQNGEGVLVNLPLEEVSSSYWMCMLGLPERIKMSEVADLYRENFEWLLLENGGKIENGMYYIPRAKMTVPEVIFYEDFESRNLGGYTLFGGGVALTAENIYEGVSSMKITGAKEESGLYKTVTGLTVGAQYRMVCYVRTAQNATAQIFARAKGDVGVYATVYDQSEYYVRRTFVFTATAETMEIGVRVPVGSSALVDHLTLTRVAETAVGTAKIAAPTANGAYNKTVSMTVTGTAGKEVLLKIGFANPTGAIVDVSVMVNGTRFNTAPFYMTGADTATNKADHVYIPILLQNGENTVTLSIGGKTIYIRSVEVVTLTDRW